MIQFKKPNEIITEMKSVIEKFTPLVCGVFAERNFPHTEDAVRFLIERFAINKYDLINLLRQHPDWDEDRFMIIHEIEVEREIDSSIIIAFVQWCKGIFGDTSDFSLNLKTQEERDHIESFVNNSYALTCLRRQKLNQEDTTCIASYLGHIYANDEDMSPKEGQKTSRWVNKFLKKYYPEIYKNENYNAAFAKYSDAVNPSKTKRKFIISLNPIDYLLSSHGNSWRTCQYIGRYRYRGEDINGVSQKVGEYAAGTISYMLDRSAIVTYTLKEDFEGDRPELQPKITRCMFAYQNYKLLQQRVYPAANDGMFKTYESYMNEMKEVISKCIGANNEWENMEVNYHCSSGYEARNYQDWYEQSYECSYLCGLKDYLDMAEIHERITVGAMPYDIYYGGRQLDYCGKLTERNSVAN